MTILSTQAITGDGTEQAIDLPSVPSPAARVVFLFDDFEEDLILRQGADGPEIRIPAGEPQPFPAGPWRLSNAPKRLVVANGDSVDVSIVRVHA